MLFRKTFRNALATLLGMALAGGTAHAAVNLDALTPAMAGTNLVSLETFYDTSGRTVTAGGVDYYRITLTSTDGRVEGTVGARATNTRTLYVRYGLENMVFARSTADVGDPHGTSLTSCVGTVCIPDGDNNETLDTAGATGVRLTKEFGGNARDDFVVYSVAVGDTLSNSGGLVAAAKVIALFHNELAMLSDRAGSVTQSVHLTLADARTGRDALSSKTQVYVAPVTSVRTVPTPGQVTATVGTGFAALAGRGRNAIGLLTIGIGRTSDTAPHHKNAQDGSDVAALADVAQAGNVARGSGSLITFSGDFSVGAFSANTVTGTTPPACGTGGTLATVVRDEVQDSVSIPAAIGTTAFCVSASRERSGAFEVGQYRVFVDYDGLTNAAFPPLDLGRKESPVLIGSIRRDGTRVNIPYLTTFTGYTQRVVLVNRNSGAVTYSFGFVEEEGTTATPGDMAEGSVPANSTLVLRAADIVSLAGKTRTAATLDVVAPNGTVDVATTQVNQDDQGTDTVIYQTVVN